MSEDMLLKWFCDRRPSVTEAKLFTDEVSIISVGEGDKLGLCNFKLDAVMGHKLVHGGKPTRSEIGKIDGGGFKQMKAGS